MINLIFHLYFLGEKIVMSLFILNYYKILLLQPCLMTRFIFYINYFLNSIGLFIHEVVDFNEIKTHIFLVITPPLILMFDFSYQSPQN